MAVITPAAAISIIPRAALVVGQEDAGVVAVMEEMAEGTVAKKGAEKGAGLRGRGGWRPQPPFGCPLGCCQAAHSNRQEAFAPV